MPEKAKIIRSVRVDPEVWSAARERAQQEGVTMSHVVQELVAGYAERALSLPQITRVYPTR